MENIKIVLNDAIVTKLKITALDLKYMGDEDLNELIEIRKKLKKYEL